MARLKQDTFAKFDDAKFGRQHRPTQQKTQTVSGWAGG